ncbi:hypothetical protein F5X98DRAFT_99127 [Xylaria grammica]|nr:hypothetical protein F5X98DRAFT_99127 [Xylaria grammica]
MPSPPQRGYRVLVEGHSHPMKVSICHIQTLLSISFVALLTAMAFALGRYSAGTVGNILSLPMSPTVFIYNRPFAENTENADTLWDALFPRQRGFFTHPTIAPHRSTFSVYHTLHCLNGIRQGHWMLYDFALGDSKVNESTIPMMLAPPHIRHCIDLLWQSLMCNPDLTIEVKDEALGGLSGFVEQYSCIEWNELKSWTETFESRK